jgi:hypothetical protein
MSSKRSAAQDKKATNLELDKGLAASGADKKMDNFWAVVAHQHSARPHTALVV